MILSTIIEKLIEFVQNLIITPVAEMLENVYDEITNFALQASPPQNVLDFCGACIKTFIPIKQIGVALAIIIPSLAINLIVRLFFV